MSAVLKPEPYRPPCSNEGDAFYSAYCTRCVHEQAHIKSDGYEDGCDVLADSYAYDIDDPNYPAEWTYTPGLGACCASFQLADGFTPPRCNLTADLFKVAS